MRTQTRRVTCLAYSVFDGVVGTSKEEVEAPVAQDYVARNFGTQRTRAYFSDAAPEVAQDVILADRGSAIVVVGDSEAAGRIGVTPVGRDPVLKN